MQTITNVFEKSIKEPTYVQKVLIKELSTLEHLLAETMSDKDLETYKNINSKDAKEDFRVKNNLPSHIPDDAILVEKIGEEFRPCGPEPFFTGCIYTKEGYYAFFLNGHLHCEDGPALKRYSHPELELENQGNLFFLHGAYYSYSEEATYSSYKNDVKFLKAKRNSK